MTTKTRSCYSIRYCALAGVVVLSLVLATGCPTPPAGPAIGLTPASLTFAGMEFSGNPADQTIQLSNTGIDTLDWDVSENADWLTVTPTTGSTTTGTETLTVSVDITGLAAIGSPYTAQITVSAAGASNTPRTVNVTLTLTALACETIGGPIDVDTTLTGACYIVESDLTVSSGATLTINPGVTLRFQQGHDMSVSSSGRLSAVGTAAQPIVFTGVEQTRGYWGGLRFYQSNSTENQLDHVTIEYGGGYHNANLYLDGTSSSPVRLDMTNCTLRGSETYGFSFDGDTVIGAFSGNTITGNTLGAGNVAADVAGYLDDTSTYTGNDEDVVAIWGSTVEADQTWAGIDGDYLATGDITVSAHLTIAPGARLVFEAGQDMTVNASGALTAAGTVGQPIVFTGVEQTRGYWGGLRFYQSNSTENQLDHVTIEYGGGYHNANLYLDGTSSSPVRLDMTNCTLRGSETYGFSFDGDTVIGAFSGNTITGNTLGAGNVAADVAGYLDDTSTYTGNDEDVVAIWGSTVEADQTWAGIDGDYLATGDITVSAHLTIAPGARLVFEAGQDMTVNASGALTAAGTVGQPIVFTGVEQTRGYWGGLRFYQSNSTENQLDHVTIEYGGGYHNANLYLDGTSSSPVRLDMTNCTLRGSETYGFSFDGDTIIGEFGGNTITGNTLGAGNSAADAVGYLDDTSTYTGNDEDVVAIWGSTVYTDQTWAGIDGNYLATGDITVAAHLTIAAGARLVFEAGQDMTVNSAGALTAVGTVDQPIVFTGVEQTRGYWGGLRYYQSNSPENALDFVTIEYGGGYHNANLYLDGTSSSPVQLSVTNCTFQHSETWGIYLDVDSIVNGELEAVNTFFDNASGDIRWP